MKVLPAICVALCLCFSLFAQNKKNNLVSPAPTPAPEIAANVFVAPNVAENLTNELVELRKIVQTLNKRLTEIGDKLAAPDKKSSGDFTEKQQRVLLALEILKRAEERAEILRKQLIELGEKENEMKCRLIQIEEEIRPENIERNLSGFGTTRTPEIREARRKSLDTERSGLRNLLYTVEQNRSRLAEDVRQADLLVQTLRQRFYPLLKKEIENFSLN